MTDTLLTFVHISDTHIHADPAYTGEFVTFTSRPAVAALVEQINTLPFHVDFVLHTGDIMTDPERAEDYWVARDLLSPITVPMYFLPGNHDRPDAMQRVLLQTDHLAVTTKMDYQFDVNGVQIVCLDTHQPDSAAGHLSEAQLAWLDAICAALDDRPMVVALHHHALPLLSPWLDSIALANGEDLHRVLVQARGRLRGVFYGHIHENIATTRDGITYYSVLSSWFQTRTWPGQVEPFNDPIHDPGFNVVTLTARDTFVRFYRFKPR
jgi:Icc protein